MLRSHPSALRRLTLAGVAATTLLGCYPPAQSTDPTTPWVQGEARFTQSLLVDLDPMRGAAFERPTRQVLQSVNVAGALRVAVEFPKVTHDAATGRTTVTMQITNAGDALTYLKCNLSGDRKVLDPAWGFTTAIAPAAATQTVDLQFENPGGGGFTAQLTFTGTLNPRASLPVGAGTAPSPSPTSAPTAEPTAAPDTGLTASASSSYGSLQARLAIDGDLASQWSNDGYQAASAWLMLDAGAVKPLTGLSLKMRPQSGTASYVIETSTDGQSFQAATGPLRNSSWNVEPKPLTAPVQARYARVRFTNDAQAPEVRFSVFEAQWNGASAPAATPPSPPPATASPPAGSYFADFESLAEGAEPSDWVDVRSDGHSYPWLVDAPWRIATHNGSKQYMHDGLSNTANLSFRRYRGNAFGPNGQLPRRYFTELDVTPIKSYTYAPTGDQGTQVYYLDPTHYVEVLLKPQLFEAWVASDAAPFQGKGWSRIYYANLATAAGQTRRLGATIDTVAHTMTLHLDGRAMATVTTSQLADRPHYYALRGTGNIVMHDNVRIEPR